MQRLQVAHGKFEAETQQAGTSARDRMLKELAAGYDAYQELTNNLQEGTQVFLFCVSVCMPSCLCHFPPVTVPHICFMVQCVILQLLSWYF